MPSLSFETLQHYRQKTYRTTAELRVRTIEQAVEFVNQRGFIFFWPIQDIALPSLWIAVNGDRPVPDEHDDPGHITWEWKDRMLGKQQWYYARTLRQRNTMISLDCLPYFYALSPNYGDYENDYLDQYSSGTLTQEAKQLYEALLLEGPLDTLALRRAARLQSSGSDTRFNKALNDLQVQFKILPIGVASVGAWHYAFIYDIAPRHFPHLVEQAGPITESMARSTLLEKYFLSVGAARLRDINKLFHWRLEDSRRCIESLKANYAITDNVELNGSNLPGRSGEEWLALSELIQT
jgi:hypothetical protein